MAHATLNFNRTAGTLCSGATAHDNLATGVRVFVLP